MINLLILISCAPICKEKLSALNSVEDVLGTCTIPIEMPETITCLNGVESDSIENRALLFEQCNLQSYTSQNRYLFATENMLEATKVFLYLKEKKEEGVDELFSKFVEKSAYPVDLPYKKQNKGKAKTLPTDVHITQKFTNINSIGTQGEYPLWGTETTLKSPWILLNDQTDIQTVRHHLSSKDNTELNFVFQDQGIHYITIHEPTKSDAVDVFWKNGSLSSFDSTTSRLRLHVSNNEKIVNLLPALSNIEQVVELDISAAPCSTMDGMKCYEGNSSIHTFYLDEQSNDDKCLEPYICKSSKGTWAHANETCRSQGKRLPTLKEAKTANRTEVFWTSEWEGTNKKGERNCADLYPCSRRKVKKLRSDSSSLLPSKAAKGAIFCALDYPALFSTRENPPFTFALTEQTLPELKPEPSLAKLAKDTIRHDDLNDKGICGEDVQEKWIEKLRNAGGGRSTTECRDPFSYVTPNEPMRYIWAKYFNNIGGGYAGVGSDQNYDFVSVAKSRWAWLYDYDPNVYRLHKILKPMILHAENPDQFVAMFDESNKKETTRIIKEFYKDLSNIDQKILVRFFSGYRKKLQKHYIRSKKTIKVMPKFGWLANPEHYTYIRTMHQQNRIVPVAGDMLAENGLRSIGDAAKKMNIPIRIFYTSNAPTAWGGQITDGYRKNVTNFPFDQKSLVLTTFNSGGFDQKGYWHHNIANGLLTQYRIGSGYYSNYTLNWDRMPTPHGDMTTTALPTVVFGE